MLIDDLSKAPDQYAMLLAQGRSIDSKRVRNTQFTWFKGEPMSLADKLKAKAASLKSGKKSTSAKPVPSAKKKAAKKSSSGKTVTPRSESKTAIILEMLKSGASREKIQKKYGMAKLSDVSWYISKFKAKGLLPKSFERE